MLSNMVTLYVHIPIAYTLGMWMWTFTTKLCSDISAVEVNKGSKWIKMKNIYFWVYEGYTPLFIAKFKIFYEKYFSHNSSLFKLGPVFGSRSQIFVSIFWQCKACPIIGVWEWGFNFKWVAAVWQIRKPARRIWAEMPGFWHISNFSNLLEKTVGHVIGCNDIFCRKKSVLCGGLRISLNMSGKVVF